MAISPMLPQYVLAHTRTHIPQPPFPRNAVPRATNGISAGFLKCAPFCGTRDPPQGEASDRVMVVFASNQVRALNHPPRAQMRGREGVWAAACDELFELRAR